MIKGTLGIIRTDSNIREIKGTKGNLRELKGTYGNLGKFRERGKY